MLLLFNWATELLTRPARQTVLQFFVPEPANNAEPVTQIAHPRTLLPQGEHFRKPKDKQEH